MLLVLSVQLYRNAPAAVPLRVEFSDSGGTIGRASGNDLVLDDPGKSISRTHARVSFRNGTFYFADVGSNPSIVNDRPLGNGREVPLVGGEQLIIGEYQIEVQVLPTLADSTVLPPEVPPPTAALPLFEPPQRAPAVVRVLQPLAAPAPAEPTAPGLSVESLPDPLAGASILSNAAAGASHAADPLGLNLFAGYAGSPGTAPGMGVNSPGVGFQIASSDHAAPENQALPSLPVAPWQGRAIPADYDPLADFLPKARTPLPAAPAAPPIGESAVPPRAAATPAAAVSAVSPLYAAPAAPSAPAGEDATLEALLRGLGLPGLRTSRSAAQLAELVGAMLREATAGAMQTLMARAVTKRESHVEMTMIVAKGNNPLKFFPDADSALIQMLSQESGGYMPPVRAFENAFEDLQAHELAVMAGLRAGLSAVLGRFDPAAIDRQIAAPSALDKVLGSSRKARMWERFVALYAEIARETDDDFQRLFGDSFAAAYEQQIERMHQRGK